MPANRLGEKGSVFKLPEQVDKKCSPSPQLKNGNKCKLYMISQTVHIFLGEIHFIIVR